MKSKYGIWVRSIPPDGVILREFAINDIKSISLNDGKMIIESKEGEKVESIQVRFTNKSIFGH